MKVLTRSLAVGVVLAIALGMQPTASQGAPAQPKTASVSKRLLWHQEFTGKSGTKPNSRIFNYDMGGGGTVWDSITYDPVTDLVYFGTANAEPWNPSYRNTNGAGDSLYTASIVAVKPDTGEYVWHFQETPEDRWDFDSNQQITVTDLTIGGQKRRVVMHAPKNGYFFVLDAKTGAFVAGNPFVDGFGSMNVLENVRLPLDEFTDLGALGAVAAIARRGDRGRVVAVSDQLRIRVLHHRPPPSWGTHSDPTRVPGRVRLRVGLVGRDVHRGVAW